MAINFLPLGNAIDLVTSAVTDSITGSAITDAILTAVLKTEGGVTLATSSALTHTSGGVYKGTFDISGVSLTLNTHYYLSLAASNYAVQWKRLYRAEDRPLQGSGSASVDTTPGTSGLTTITGVAVGDGAGGFSGETPLSLVHGGTANAVGVSANAAPRQATYVVAASDSANEAGAHLICTGTADQVAINALIAAQTGPVQIFFRAGTYTLTDEIVVNKSFITLQGETKPHFLLWNGFYPTHSTPGFGAKFVQTVSGKNGFHVDTSGARKGAIALRNLYVLGQNYNGTGIYGDVGTDISEISHCCIQGFQYGLFIGWDTPQLVYNDIQDNSGDGITTTNIYGIIHGNICFDIGGYGINCASNYTQITGNSIGSLGAAGIHVQGNYNTITGNAITRQTTSGIEIAEGTGSGIGTVISGNTIDVGDNAISGDGIKIGSGSNAVTNCSITGNVVRTGHNQSGYGIACRQSSTVNAIVGNSLIGSWNGGSGTRILWGSGNIGTGTNAGDA